jgi:hypothetical protein
MKLAMKLVLVVLVLLVLAGIGVALSVDRLASTAIERGGGYALGVETQVGSTDLGIMSGRIHLGDVVVENPEGFTSDHFLRLAEGSAEVELGTLLEDVVEVSSLSLTGLDVNLERQGGKSNHQVILDHIKSREKDDEPGQAPGAEEQGKGYVVRELVVEDVTVHADLLPVGGELTVPVKQIRLTDVGSGSDRGILLWELSGVLVKAILAAVVESGQELPGEVLDSLKQNLGELEDLAGFGIEVTTGVGQAADKIEKSVEEGAAKALEDLRDIVDDGKSSGKQDDGTDGDGPR